MKSFIAALLTTQAVATHFRMRSVRELNDGNFRNGASEKATVAIFSKGDCPACNAQEPSFLQAATEANTKGLHVQFVKVHCQVSEETCKKHIQGGYPTIKYFDVSTNEQGNYHSNGSSKEQLLSLAESISPRSGYR